MKTPTLVISLDGVMPRALARTSAPRLGELLRAGAGCMTARTIEPPITAPAHASMLHGVEPATHGVTSNDTVSVAPGPRSFLRVAREAGLRTASLVSWAPLHALIERDAAHCRLLVGGDEDPDYDREIARAARQLIVQGEHDLLFVYFCAPDLAGHSDGWMSPAYLDAVRRTDAYVGSLLDVLDPAAPVLVTTDHGGLGKDHHEPVPEVMETFVIARAPAISPGSMWEQASIVDVAPTVAQLAGFAPDPAWEGRALVGLQASMADYLLARVEEMTQYAYGEQVDMHSHALQAAANLRADGASDALVVAGLLHDIGHLVGSPGTWGDPDHAEIGASYLAPWFAADVVEPIRLHVQAKRYLVATDRSVYARLSEASQQSLAQQGGPLDAEATAAFAALPFAEDAIRLRHADDAGKVPGAEPRLADFAPALRAALLDDDAAGIRDACACPACRDPATGQSLLSVLDLDGWRLAPGADPASDVVELRHCDGRSHVCRVGLRPTATGPSVANRPVAGVDDTRANPSLCAAAPGGSPGIRGWSSTHIATLRDAANDVSVERFACDLVRDGIALMADVETTPGEVLRFAQQLGFVRRTNYGELFDVVSRPDPNNLAYTSRGLALHTDNPYRDPVPTVQLLHCLEAAPTGGASRFVDGFAVAEALRREQPDAFAVLSSVPIGFRFVDDDVDLYAEQPLIGLDARGAVSRIAVNHRSMVTPPPSVAARFYPAYRAFVERLEAVDNVIGLTLRPGELVAFDNRRVLHGREAFDVSAPRHMQGCYIDIDAVRSRVRRALAA